MPCKDASSYNRDRSIAGSTDKDNQGADPAPQSGDPNATPVEPVWSPQYSPNRLADLLPEIIPSVKKDHTHVHAAAHASLHSHHAQALPEPARHTGPSEPALQQQSPSRPTRQPSGHGGQSNLAHMHRGRAWVGHMGQEHPQQQAAEVKFESSTAPLSGVPTDAVHRHHSPSPPLLPLNHEQSMDPAAAQYSGMLPSSSVAYSAGPQSFPQGHRQHPAFHSASGEQHNRQDAYSNAGQMHSRVPFSTGIAPGDAFHQSEQSLRQVYAAPTNLQASLPYLGHTHGAHENRPAGPVTDHPDAHYSPQAHGHVHDPSHMSDMPQMQGSRHHAGGINHAEHMFQGAPAHGNVMYTNQLPGHLQQHHQQYMGDASGHHQGQADQPIHHGHTVQLPVSEGLQYESQTVRPHQMAPIKAEPGTSAPFAPDDRSQVPASERHAQHMGQYAAAHQLPYAQSSTMLSPELSAALAAGVFGQSLEGSAQRPSTDAQPQLSHNQRQMHMQASHHHPPRCCCCCCTASRAVSCSCIWPAQPPARCPSYFSG